MHRAHPYLVPRQQAFTLRPLRPRRPRGRRQHPRHGDRCSRAAAAVTQRAGALRFVHPKNARRSDRRGQAAAVKDSFDTRTGNEGPREGGKRRNTMKRERERRREEARKDGWSAAPAGDRGGQSTGT